MDNKTAQTPGVVSSQRALHAHFDCFSGAAGDMMLASCLDAAEDPEGLLAKVVDSIRKGLPPIAEEFQISSKRVWRGSGSITALHVTVESIYKHKAAPVPAKTSSSLVQTNTLNHNHVHEHEQHNGEDEAEHNHSHGHRSTNHPAGDGYHQHSHDHESSDDLKTGDGLEHGHEQCHEHSHEHHHEHASGHEHSHDHDGSRTKGPLRNLPEIRTMFQDAPEEYVPAWVRVNAIEAFTELAKAEASVHGASGIDAVHFHEVGAVDSIVDTIGTLLGLYFLGVKSVSCSPLPLGEGTVFTDHGILPVPAPATLRLMIGIRTTPGPPGVTGELVTPTAAALLRVLTKTSPGKQVGRPPRFTIRSVGVGAGTKDFQKHPNILRLMLGDDLVLDERKAVS